MDAGKDDGHGGQERRTVVVGGGQVREKLWLALSLMMEEGQSHSTVEGI